MMIDDSVSSTLKYPLQFILYIFFYRTNTISLLEIELSTSHSMKPEIDKTFALKEKTDIHVSIKRKENYPRPRHTRDYPTT